MKICRKCGARQRDSRLYCVDCGTRLERRLTAEEEAQEQENLDQTMEKLYNRRDPLFVSLLDRICGWIDLAGFVVLLVLLVLAGAGVFPAGKPSSDAVAVVFIGAFFFLIGALEAFFPRVTWAIEQFRMSFWINGAEDAEPSDFYFAARRVTVLLSVAAGLMAIALLLYGLLQTPEPVPDAAELFRQMTESRKADGRIASPCRFFML